MMFPISNRLKLEVTSTSLPSVLTADPDGGVVGSAWKDKLKQFSIFDSCSSRKTITSDFHRRGCLSSRATSGSDAGHFLIGASSTGLILTSPWRKLAHYIPHLGCRCR